MFDFFYGKIKTIFTQIIPGLTMAGIIFISVIPFRIIDISSIFPALPYMVLYFWSIRRDDCLSYLFVFLLGILNDTISNHGLFGISEFLFLSMRWAGEIIFTYLQGKTFLRDWIGFIVIFGLNLLMQWLLLSWLKSHFVSWKMIVLEFILAVFCYPIVNWILSSIESLGHPDH
jgi:cell shape-determining protein MreD